MRFRVRREWGKLPALRDDASPNAWPHRGEAPRLALFPLPSNGLTSVRVLYVWDAEYPWDVRTEKVCLALVRDGHHVVITARNLYARPRTEVRPEGTVERIPAGPALGRRWASFPAFFNPRWLWHLGRIIRKHHINLIIVRDVPLAPAALLFSRRRRPVILDMAENYPAMIRDVWTDRRQRPFDFLIRNPWLVAGIERVVIRRVDHVLTVVEESSQRLVTLGVPTERVSVVSNTPPKARITGPVSHAPEEPLRVIYLGLMEQHRGVSCTLDASAMLKQARVPFHLHLVGDGRDYDDLRRHAAALGLTTEEVTFHGRLTHGDAIALVSRADVGLVPHEARESWNTTIPNKLFDYMAAGLTVITSDAAPAARVVRETGAGLVFRSGDGRHLAERIRQCVDPIVRDQHRRAGQEAIRARYNWESDTRVLLDVVSRVGEGGSVLTTDPENAPVRVRQPE
jgi:glycosyltransferase involved in cell wall biosynthesis